MRPLLQKPFVQALLVVAVILGGTYLLFGPGPSTPNENMENMEDMMDDQPVAQSHRSYEVEAVSSLSNIQPNQPRNFIYKIKDDQGSILKDFDVVHEKVMHFIVARKDLQYFQHLHPSFDSTTGEFVIPITFASDGDYRAFADFTPSMSQVGPDGTKLPVTIFKDIKVGNLAIYKPLPIDETERVKTYGDYEITLVPSSDSITSKNNQNFDFEIRKNGELVTNLQTYLGALGHTVVLREGNLQFVHAHATQKPTDLQTGKVSFAITFPEAGNYKLFSQFQHEDKIITSDFVVNVAEGKENPSNSAPHGGTQQH